MKNFARLFLLAALVTALAGPATHVPAQGIARRAKAAFHVPVTYYKLPNGLKVALLPTRRAADASDSVR